MEVRRVLPVTVGEAENACKTSGLVVVSLSQAGSCGDASCGGAGRTKCPPIGSLGGSGVARGWSAVGRLLRPVVVHAIGAVECRTPNGCCGRDGGPAGSYCRWVGHGDTTRHIAFPRQHQRGSVHRSLIATIIA